MQNTTQRGRIEIIYELAHYAHQDWYHSLLTWSTPALRILLEYYERPEEKEVLSPLRTGEGFILKFN
jgi:hypothetical protein